MHNIHAPVAFPGWPPTCTCDCGVLHFKRPSIFSVLCVSRRAIYFDVVFFSLLFIVVRCTIPYMAFGNNKNTKTKKERTIGLAITGNNMLYYEKQYSILQIMMQKRTCRRHVPFDRGNKVQKHVVYPGTKYVHCVELHGLVNGRASFSRH